MKNQFTPGILASKLRCQNLLSGPAGRRHHACPVRRAVGFVASAPSSVSECRINVTAQFAAVSDSEIPLRRF